MSLSKEAFLSPEVDALAAEALSVFAPTEVSLVQRVNRFAVGVVKVPRDIRERDSDLFAATLLGRSIQDFEGAVILAARGLRAQSRSLVRSTLETALYCVAASRDQVLAQGAARKAKKDEPSTTRFIDAIEGGHQRHRSQMASGLQGLPETPPELAGSMRTLLDEIGTPGQHQDVNLLGLAEDLGLSDLYTVVYRPLSQDAHPTATSLEHHIELTAERKIAGLRIGPDYEQFAETLLLAVCSLFVALDGFLERFGDNKERQEMKALAAAYRQACEPGAQSS